MKVGERKEGREEGKRVLVSVQKEDEKWGGKGGSDSRCSWISVVLGGRDCALVVVALPQEDVKRGR